VPITQVEIDFAKKLKVGVSAANISAKPFVATFENFAVINSDTQLEALFGDGEIPKEKKEEKPAQ
jgi:hypothetical protein